MITIRDCRFQIALSTGHGVEVRIQKKCLVGLVFVPAMRTVGEKILASRPVRRPALLQNGMLSAGAAFSRDLASRINRKIPYLVLKS